MKKTVFFVIAVILILVSVESVFASDYTLGLKLWANSWRETVHPQTGESQSFNNGDAVMAGPSLSVRAWDKWFVNATYLMSLAEYQSSDWIAPGDTMKFKRRDLDLRAGRMFRPPYLFRPDPGINLGVYLGYKTIDAPASYTNPAAGFSDSGVGTWKQKGPGFGFLADMLLNESTTIYVDLAFYSLKQEFRFLNGGQSQPFNAHGTVYEFGVARTFTGSLTANIGLKGEHTTGTEESGEADINDFFGLIAGIAYGF